LQQTGSFKTATSDMKSAMPDYFKPQPRVQLLSSTHTSTHKRLATEKANAVEKGKVLQAAWGKGEDAATHTQADIGPKQQTRLKNDVLHRMFSLGVGDTIRTAKLIR
jgi:hypothetical protein